MSKKPKYYHRLKEPSFDTCIYMIIDPDRNNVVKRIKKDFGVLLNENYKTEGDAAYFDIPTEKGTKHFIWVRSFTWLIQETALLHHEMLHLTFDIMRVVGIQLCKESEESYTYFYQKLIMEVYDVLRKMHPDFKKKRKP